MPYFNPRAPRGARRRVQLRQRETVRISIHAPLAGRDFHRWRSSPPTWGISIHAPLAGRDCILSSLHIGRIISIHAPLAGRDCAAGNTARNMLHFNPRAPRGARHSPQRCHSPPLHFNPRAPRGARQQMCTKITYIFALTHKRNTFSCQTPSVRALSKKLSGRFSHKIRCEPPCKTMCAAAPHYTISVPSGRYVCLQPKCSILLSYFFPK